MRRPLVALTLLAAVVVALFGAFSLLDLVGRSEARETRPLGALRELHLETDFGDVTVRATDGAARLEIRTRRSLISRPEVKVTRDEDGRISVRTGCSGLVSVSCSATIVAHVPAGTPVIARTGSGDLAVEGMRAGAEVRTGSGDLSLTGVTGPVAARAGSGDVKGAEIDADTLSADTGSGDIALALGAAPREVRARTGSGDLRLELPDAGYRVEVHTGSGDEDVRVRQDPSASRVLRLDTGSGDVSVHPAAPGAVR